MAQDFTEHTDAALAKITAASAPRTREERIVGYHARQIAILLASHDHTNPGPCPACVCQIKGIAELVPGLAVDRGEWACPDCGAQKDELCFANCPRFREDPEVPGE